jgi:hypothetical protein
MIKSIVDVLKVQLYLIIEVFFLLFIHFNIISDILFQVLLFRDHFINPHLHEPFLFKKLLFAYLVFTIHFSTYFTNSYKSFFLAQLQISIPAAFSRFPHETVPFSAIKQTKNT